tara:strand:- start:1816 stop:2346 length:531 start_codon:yes stop_codon:yes gene_type:complete
MARITVEDCIDKFPSRFELVLVASNRARKLHSGENPTIDKDNDKNTVIALREIAEEALTVNDLKNDLIEDYQTATLDEDEELELTEGAGDNIEEEGAGDNIEEEGSGDNIEPNNKNLSQTNNENVIDEPLVDQSSKIETSGDEVSKEELTSLENEEKIVTQEDLSSNLSDNDTNNQ